LDLVTDYVQSMVYLDRKLKVYNDFYEKT